MEFCFPRIVWILLIQLAMAGTIYSCLTQYKRYRASPTVMSVEKDYRSWNGTLPAGTIRLQNDLDERKANEFINSHFQDNSTEDDREYFMGFLQALINATAENYAYLAEYGGDERLERLDLFEVAMMVRKPVGNMVKIRTFDSSVKIELEPIISEKGLCYIFNSAMADVLQERYWKGGTLKKPLPCRYGKQECYFKLDVYGTTISIDVHSPYEFSDPNVAGIAIERLDEMLVSYKIFETVTSDSLRDLTPSQRKCLYPDEALPAYGKSLCYMRCRGKMALNMCGCVPHFYPFLDGVKCTPSGYECLLDFKWPGWSLNLCSCPRTCLELKYPIHNIVKSNWNSDSNVTVTTKSTFTLQLEPPKVRNRISVVFSFEDLLVSFGGAASLFLGISLWSLLNTLFLAFKRLVVHIRHRKCEINPASM